MCVCVCARVCLSMHMRACTCTHVKLEKVYRPDNEEDDMVEMEEERLRMREHVMNEVLIVMLINHVTMCQSGVVTGA